MELERRTARAQLRVLAAIPNAAVIPLLVFVFALVPAGAVALHQPLWSRVDEAQHFDFIAQLANGTYPISDQTTLRPETVRIMDRTGIYRWFQPNGDAQPSETDPRSFRMPPPSMPAVARTQWMWRHIWTFSYEAFQPPLYYLLMVPLYAAGSALGGPVAAVYLLRLANALLMATLAPLAWLLAREVLPGRPWFAIAAGAAAVAIPGLVVNLTQVTNDTLAAVLGALLIVLAVRWMRAGFTARKAVGLGVLAGAAVLAKLTVLGLVPAVAVALVGPALNGREPGSLPHRLSLGALCAGVAGVVVAPWVFVNERLYGHAVPPHSFMSAVFLAPKMSLRVARGDVVHALGTYWGGEPAGVLPLGDPVLQYALFWTLAACAGLALVVFSSRPFATGTLLVLATAIAGEAVLAGVMPVFSQVGGLTPGRYLYPIAPAAATLLVAGTWTLMPIPPARASVVLCMVGVALASISAFLHGYTGDRAVLAKHYQPPPNQGVPVTAHGTIAGVRVKVDRFVDDSTSGSVWIHVVVDNPTSKPIEWWPRPDVILDGGPQTRTDYGRSQPLPETVQPGQHDDVWLVAPVTKPGPYHRLDLLFEAIAAYDYRLYGNLMMETPIPPAS